MKITYTQAFARGRYLSDHITDIYK